MAKQTIRLSDMARDPVVAAFFRRGEDGSDTFAVPAAPKPTLPSTDGRAKRLEVA